MMSCFLTLESDQSGPGLGTDCGATGVAGECDLNDDGDADDLLVQVFNRVSGETTVVAEVVDTGATLEDPDTAVDPLSAPQPDSGQEAGGEQVVVTMGRCVEDTTDACTAGLGTCSAGGFLLRRSR